jgi:DNA-binding SARP family transcriptional activator
MTAQRAAMRILARQPYNERAAGLMMQILSKRGNRAEALDIYERTRTLIRDELGVSPSDWLQSIHSGLLRGH